MWDAIHVSIMCFRVVHFFSCLLGVLPVDSVCCCCCCCFVSDPVIQEWVECIAPLGSEFLLTSAQTQFMNASRAAIPEQRSFAASLGAAM
jgi:hypothetical protein